MSTDTKWCNDCEQWKDIDDFSRRSKTTESRLAYCKPCLVIRARKWQIANPKKFNAYMREWASKNREKACQYQKNRREADLEAARAREREWYAKRKQKKEAGG